MSQPEGPQGETPEPSPTGGQPGPGTPVPPAQPPAWPAAGGQPGPGTPAPPAPPPGPPPASGYPPAGYPAAPGQWQPGQYPPAPKTETNAIVAFVLALVSWTVCPVIPAIIALVLANKAEQAIRAGAPMVEGQGLVTASRWISWINIAVWGVGVALFLVIVLLAAINGA